MTLLNLYAEKKQNIAHRRRRRFRPFRGLTMGISYSEFMDSIKAKKNVTDTEI